jgi:molybdopterin synthase sulfur carrier subunit
VKGKKEMSQKVIIPTLLRRLTDNADAVEVDAATVRDILDRLDERYPGFRARVCEETGELRRFINIYVDGEDVRFLDNLATTVPERAEVSIVPAIAGG